MDCISTERMLEIINQDDASIDTTEFENHLSNCRECSERFEALMRDASKSRPLSAAHSAPQTVMLDSINRDLQCVVCGHDKFYSRKAQLNTAFLTFLDLDWLNRSANCHVCAKCGYIHWFL